jgi:hypothetical protein
MLPLISTGAVTVPPAIASNAKKLDHREISTCEISAVGYCDCGRGASEVE